MAKGARAVSVKRKRNALREKVINPVYDARTQRLSAKLLELASKPRPKEEAKMDLDEESNMKASPVEDDLVREQDSGSTGLLASASLLAVF